LMPRLPPSRALDRDHLRKIDRAARLGNFRQSELLPEPDACSPAFVDDGIVGLTLVTGDKAGAKGPTLPEPRSKRPDLSKGKPSAGQEGTFDVAPDLLPPRIQVNQRSQRSQASIG